MATVDVSTQSHSQSRWRLALACALVLPLLLVLGGLAWLYAITRSALPQLDGTLAVQGLSAPVHVTRDAHGIPTIDASNFDDLFFAQGYVTAQDRLFQMDAMRRYASGELAEIVGAGQVEHDRQQRILGIREAARKNLQSTTPEDRTRLQAYARGVNAFIDSHRDRLPIEFRILRYSPKSWAVEDSLAIAAYMVEDLTVPVRHVLDRENILAKLGPELTADLYVNTSWRERPPTMNVAAPDQDEDRDKDDDEDDDSDDDSSVTQLFRRLVLQPQFPQQRFFEPRAIGSNNWVVSGAHTISGKPLLSNDMHLGHQMPNLWYAAHLRCSSFDAAGATLPGYPYVIAGHNQRIAWGFTNIGPAVQDIYVETFNQQGQYLTPDGWKQPEHRAEVIHVKNAPDVTLDVQVTRHGPIVTDLAPGETRKLALRWTLYDGIRDPFFAADTAHNWDEFRNAFSQLDAPAQNVVYADVDGNIGYQATGKIPIRAQGDGSLPEDGSNSDHEWVSYIPFDKLPQIFNPPSGIIATANSRITPDHYPYSVSNEWASPWRVSRIYRVLESGKKFSAADMLALQNDIYSEFDHFVADRLIYAVDHSQHASARAKSAADILRQWDGRMSADSAAPTIAVQARKELERILLEPRLGAAGGTPESPTGWKRYEWMMETVWLDNLLQRQPKRWLPDQYGAYDDLLTAAVEAAISRPDAPQDLNQWKWSSYNRIEIQNAVLGKIPLLNHWTGTGSQPQSGSQYTVKAVTHKTGPSERETVDLANFDLSTFNLVTGEAGNFLSPYYLDQWSAWYKGTTFQWPFTQSAVESAAKHHVTLEPGASASR